MSIASILVLQGGGALGAYECVVYQSLAPRLEIRRDACPNEEAEQISREIDFSPQRIQELNDQGRRDAAMELKKADGGQTPDQVGTGVTGESS